MGISVGKPTGSGYECIRGYFPMGSLRVQVSILGAASFVTDIRNGYALGRVQNMYVISKSKVQSETIVQNKFYLHIASANTCHEHSAFVLIHKLRHFSIKFLNGLQFHGFGQGLDWDEVQEISGTLLEE